MSEMTYSVVSELISDSIVTLIRQPLLEQMSHSNRFQDKFGIMSCNLGWTKIALKRALESLREVRL